MQDTQGYSRLQIALHWAIAVLIVLNYIISDDMGEIFDGALEGHAVTGLTPVFHVWAGTAVLVLVLVRLVTRMVSGAPAPANDTFLEKVAVWGHRALYALMLAVPALGAITWFGGIEATADLHVLVVNVLMLAALGHAAMSLFHHFVLKDGLLHRMVRVR